MQKTYVVSADLKEIGPVSFTQISMGNNDQSKLASDSQVPVVNCRPAFSEANASCGTFTSGDAYSMALNKRSPP